MGKIIPPFSIFPLRKILLLTGVLLAILHPSANGQMMRFPNQSPDTTYNGSFILTAPNNDLLYLWLYNSNLYQSRSTNNGITWSNSSYLSLSYSNYNEICGLTLASERIISVIKKYVNLLECYRCIYSNNNGLTWSPGTVLNTGTDSSQFYKATDITLSQSSTGKLFCIYSILNTTAKDIYYITSNDNGVTWSSENTFLTGPVNGSVTSVSTDKLMMVYQNQGIYCSLSTDDGVTWGASKAIIPNDITINTPRIVKNQAGILYLFYKRNIPTPFPGITQQDIVYKTSTDEGATWGTENNFTNYKGVDDYYSVSVKGNYPLISFSSDRFDSLRLHNNLWYGTAGVTLDNNAPPYYYKSDISPNPPPEHQQFKIDAYIDGINNITSVSLISKINGVSQPSLIMYDDGTHGDTTANDKIYTCQVPGLTLGDVLQTSIKIDDQNSNIGNYAGPTTGVPLVNAVNSVNIDVNRFKLPVANNGVLADVSIDPHIINGGKYDGQIVMFSGGFYLSGKSNGFLWANASFTSSRTLDYVPGRIGTIPEDMKNILYVVRSTDPHFGQSWQNWKIAVSQGADFYDGDHDGVYNPVDLNGNGQWDPNEDRPDFLGEMTAWCVFNDGVPAAQRHFTDVNPQGIEIQQTVFAQKDSADLNNVVFVRYRIINRGTVADVMDSVYFAPIDDADIGESGASDLIGCDTLLQSAYTYHSPSNITTKWGPNPPAEYISLLQGPISYIPGVTFIDINGNGIYDSGIDTPIDTAYSFKGPLLGKTIYPGAKNLIMTSANQVSKNVEPQNRFQARYNLTGRWYDGTINNPCTWSWGQVLGGINCANVNPLFIFSGDPVTRTGWINTNLVDQRNIISSGPFKLEKNKPIDVIVANIVGRGEDPLSSITVAKNYTSNTIKYFNTNFGNSIISEINDLPHSVNNFNLDQNYPNPFNPSTKIRYSVKANSLATIKVYNILGKEIATLLNEVKQPGEYTLDFNSAKYRLGSGVYFYKLTAGTFSSVKKMVLLK